MKRARAFTLIELLLVIVIVGLLASLLYPMMQEVGEKTKNVRCQNHLRDLFVMLSSAATENNDRYPKIEIDAENPVHGGDGEAKPLFETLKPYGVTEKTLQCPADLAGPNWFAKKHTSYMWQPVAEDEPKGTITIYTPRGSFPGKLSRVRLLQDWDLVHEPAEPGLRKRMNILYADGHVQAR